MSTCESSSECIVLILHLVLSDMLIYADTLIHFMYLLLCIIVLPLWKFSVKKKLSD